MDTSKKVSHTLFNFLCTHLALFPLAKVCISVQGSTNIGYA